MSVGSRNVQLGRKPKENSSHDADRLLCVNIDAGECSRQVCHKLLAAAVPQRVLWQNRFTASNILLGY